MHSTFKHYKPSAESYADATVHSKFPHLSALGIPLGLGVSDKAARSKILHELLRFNDMHNFTHDYRGGSKTKCAITIPTSRKNPTYADVIGRESRTPWIKLMLAQITPDIETSADIMC